jgi:4-hydroxy-3-polyprenylbenzoate decarboxylase
MKENSVHIVGITGASGAIIGVRLIEELLSNGQSVSAVATDSALLTINHEIVRGNKKISSIKEVFEYRKFSINIEKFTEYSNRDFFAPVASGSARFDSMVIAPCSMKTLSAVANGYSESLLLRAADVSLKENRKTILVPRETPLSLIHLENLLMAKRAGAVILPPVPGFYNHPQTIDDAVNFIVGKILNLLEISNNLIKPWGNDAR